MVNEPVRFSPFSRTACPSLAIAASSRGLGLAGAPVVSETFFLTSPISITVGLRFLLLGEFALRAGARAGSAFLVGLAIFLRLLALENASRNSPPNPNVIGFRRSSLPLS